MGRVRLPPGVEIHYGNIRISFQYCGRRCRETLNLPPTPSNLEFAGRLRREIVDRIKTGSFSYVAYFPDSDNLARLGIPAPAPAPEFGQYAKRWIDGLDHLATSTKQGYRKILNAHWMPDLWNIPIREITYTQLQQIITEKNFRSNKTRNNCISPIKLIFRSAFLDGLIDTNPAARLRFAKPQRPAPDPLTLAEINLVLSKIKASELVNYFEFAFFSGLRTSELIALRWEDIDFNAGLVRVQRAKVRGEIKGTKTNQIRDVELNSRARSALDQQKSFTFLANDWVFLDPVTGRQFAGDKPPRLHWDRALRLAGIRHRTAYQTRHSYATLHLMEGCNPMWVARQLGHTNMKMLLERYSRWIDQADNSRERNKIENILDETHLKNKDHK